MKQIRKLLFILLATTMIYSCGDAGVGFDVTADFPATAPIEITVPANPAPVDIDPDLTSLNYSLGDVSAFNDALDDLGSIGIDRDAIDIVGLSFEISGIDSSEELPLDELTVNILNGSGGIILSIPLASGTLLNVSKTSIDIGNSKSSLIDELSNTSSINSEIIVDLGSIPASTSEQNINFDFKLYFNVLLKVRDL